MHKVTLYASPELESSEAQGTSSMRKMLSRPLHFFYSIRCVASLFVLLACLVIASTSVLSANANQDVSQVGADGTDNFQLIELFTSLGCSACPAAHTLLGELLAANSELMALEFHVDYWDTLEHSSDGSFVDPYSDPANSMRQRAYNDADLSGRPGVYTPQVVINGRVVMLGSNSRHVKRALRKPVKAALKLDISSVDDAENLEVRLGVPNENAPQVAGANIMLARFLNQTEVNVTGGENKNRVLVNHHVVTSLEQIGQVPDAGDWSLRVASPPSGEGCVVLIQSEQLEALHAAAQCP